MNKTLMQAEEEARKIVNKRVALATGTGWIPGSTLGLAAMDLEMARTIGHAFGVSDSMIEAGLASVGASAIGKCATSELLNFIPGFGQIIKVGVAGSVTKATGELLIAYFKNQSSYR